MFPTYTPPATIESIAVLTTMFLAEAIWTSFFLLTFVQNVQTISDIDQICSPVTVLFVAFRHEKRNFWPRTSFMAFKPEKSPERAWAPAQKDDFRAS
jgi:hypothetical protein